jgi:hypothetical protein
MAAERKMVLRTVLQIPPDNNLVHMKDQCELGDLEMMTKYGLAPSVEKI